MPERVAAINLHVDPVRDALRELLREGIEWAEHPVRDADDAPLYEHWFENAKGAIDATS